MSQASITLKSANIKQKPGIEGNNLASSSFCAYLVATGTEEVITYPSFSFFALNAISTVQTLRSPVQMQEKNAQVVKSDLHLLLAVRFPCKGEILD